MGADRDIGWLAVWLGRTGSRLPRVKLESMETIFNSAIVHEIDGAVGRRVEVDDFPPTADPWRRDQASRNRNRSNIEIDPRCPMYCGLWLYHWVHSLRHAPTFWLRYPTEEDARQLMFEGEDVAPKPLGRFAENCPGYRQLHSRRVMGLRNSRPIYIPPSY